LLPYQKRNPDLQYIKEEVLSEFDVIGAVDYTLIVDGFAEFAHSFTTYV
jgi:hypothetical protein